MKISELILQLQTLQQLYGDLAVGRSDSDHGCEVIEHVNLNDSPIRGIGPHTDDDERLGDRFIQIGG